MAKLCAMVTMQVPRGRGGADGGSKIQDFALPLKLVANTQVCRLMLNKYWGLFRYFFKGREAIVIYHDN